MQLASPRADTQPVPCRIDDRVISLDDPFPLECGASLENLRIGMRITGPAQAPLVVALGGISASRCAVSAPGEREPGWWQGVLGASGAHLLSTHRVLGFDWLGGCGDTLGPVNWGGEPGAFPAVDARDQARLLARLLDALDCERVYAVLGASYGGMVAQHFAADWPGRVDRLLVIGCAHRPEPMAVARRYVQKMILALAGEDETAAVAAARALAMTTYRSPREFRSRFGGPDGHASLQSYLDHHGTAFAKRFDRTACLRLLDSIDAHVIDPARIRTPLTLLGFSSDELCPPELLREMAARAPGTERLIELDSIYGHDAFLCEARAVAGAIREFLSGESP